MAFARNLQYLMDKNGLTNYQLSRDLSIHATTVTNWLTETSKPIKRMQTTLANYFHIEVEELTGDELPPIVQKKEPAPKDGDGLTEGEAAMLELFRAVPEDQQQVVLALVRATLNKINGERENR